MKKEQVQYKCFKTINENDCGRGDFLESSKG